MRNTYRKQPDEGGYNCFGDRMVQERRNIWLGLGGLAFTLLAWLLLMIITAAATYVELSMPGGMDGLSDESPIAIAAGLALIAALLLNFIGLVIAIISLLSPTEKRAFPIVTVVLSVALDIVLAVLVGIGLYLG